ncbi:hypothetical protein [Saccharothrix syringae]|uniref:Protein kinase domain-containing protein n=1 Tax=Saccharothrix syringae TaxID=103733 RepID=A0A5Q0GUE6_SACSY|nr:hypothetical protein [Saccharothrix syringae]QFZ16992.1 hypothetical protein EKG83_05490 [Saccharothrix syringae]
MNGGGVVGPDAVGPLGPLLGAGGQARVYHAPHAVLPDVPGPLVYKRYKPGHEPPHGLVGVVARRLRMDPATRQRLDRCAAWPVRAVEEGGVVRGVLLPLIPDAYFADRVLPSGTPVRTLREVQHLFVDPARAVRLGMPAPSLAERVLVCRDLASAVHLLHRNDLVFGDLNAKNAVFRLDGRPCVMLVDCDAVRVKGAAAVVRQLNAPDWEPPESVLSQASDRYKLGLFVLRCLSPGPFASVARDPARLDAVLPGEGPRLLRAALGHVPGARTTAREWGHYFDALLTGTTEAAARQVAPVGCPSAPSGTPGWRRHPGTGRWVPVT